MQIAIASGKGGTGKTTVAVNLASVWSRPLTLLDCDVEEPNGHLFLKPKWERAVRVSVPLPKVDMELCTSCGDCREACRFNAVVIIAGRPLMLPELCHSCGACIRACPTDAISEVGREIGTLEAGRWKHVSFVHGKLDVGEARSEPLIEAVREAGLGSNSDGLILIDAPPGTSCPVIAAVRGSDYLLLVTEPTPFGLHDLMLAVGMGRALDLPLGVLINRSDIGDDKVREYCRGESIPILAEFPFDRRIAECYSRGEIASEALEDVREMYVALFDRLLREVSS
jgi:MinD superfamily P-loop ATPase